MKLVAVLVAFAALVSGGFQTSAPIRSAVFTSGLQSPVAFIADPTNPAVFYAVEQGGRIRIVRNGVVAEDFLDLRGATVGGGERGLLGMALAPDFPASGRFFVNFTNTNGDTVVARFRRSSAGTADPGSRFDLKWGPERSPVISQPFVNHNGGHLAFGPDGYLYIGMGDGGSGDDPQNNAQTPSTLLGKMLRIDVAVADGHLNGYVVPADNPFVSSTLPGVQAGDLVVRPAQPVAIQFRSGVARRQWRAVDRRRRARLAGRNRLRAARARRPQLWLAPA